MISEITCGLVIYDEMNDIKRILPLLQRELQPIKTEWIFILNHEEAEIRHWTKDWLTTEVEGCQVIENPSNNLGYARQLILENSRNNYIYMTDPDIELVPKSLMKLIRLAETESVLDSNLKIIGFSGTLIHKSTITFLQETYDLIQWVAKKIPFSFQIQYHSHLESVDHVPSCHLLLKRDEALQIGGFSPLFKKVGEDLDFTHRAYNLDYRFVFLPTSLAYHNQNVTISKWLYKVFQFGKVQITVQKLNFSNGLRYYRLIPLLLLCLLIAGAVILQHYMLLAIFAVLLFSFVNLGVFGFFLTLLSYSVGEAAELIYPTLELKSAEELQELKQALSEKVLKSSI